jgi:hypothetical protein
MRGVILEAELYGHGDTGGEPERVIAFLELEHDVVHVRRAYGARSAILSVELDDLEAALAALKLEAKRRPPEPMPGQTELEVDHSDAT